METAEVVTAVAEPMGSAGAAFYFAPETLARGKELGLDGFRFYILGRGGLLGDVSSAMVHGAFGYFNRPLIDRMWDSARDRLPVAEGAGAYLACCADYGRDRLSDVEGLDAYVNAATKVIQAADPSSLPLFAGASAAPVPEDLPARAMHQTAILRELRGSVHLLAVVAAGLHPGVAHAIRRPKDVAMFGYESSPKITDEHRTRLRKADGLTSELLQHSYAVLTPDEAAALAETALVVSQAAAAS